MAKNNNDAKNTEQTSCLVAVSPTKTPSQIKVLTPATGIKKHQRRKSKARSTTELSDVSISKMDRKPPPYAKQNKHMTPKPHKNNARMLLRNMAGLQAPKYFPTNASPAYAKPSMKYVNIRNNCIIKALTARVRSPLRAPADVKKAVTVSKQMLLKKISLFTLKNLPTPSPEKMRLTKEKSRYLRYFPTSNAKLIARPKYWAISVPTAIPTKPNPKQKTESKLMSTFTTFIETAIYMVKREFCIPMYHPLMAFVQSRAGAPHIHI